MEKRKIKVGVRPGGPPPEFLWSVYILDLAYREAESLFTKGQYRHLALQVQELARQSEPSRSDVVDVRPIENFYEIRERGGVLGGLNVRVFFGIDKVARAIVVLGVIKKQNDGPTPIGDKSSNTSPVA